MAANCKESMLDCIASLFIRVDGFIQAQQLTLDTYESEIDQLKKENEELNKRISRVKKSVLLKLSSDYGVPSSELDLLELLDKNLKLPPIIHVTKSRGQQDVCMLKSIFDNEFTGLYNTPYDEEGMEIFDDSTDEAREMWMKDDRTLMPDSD